MNRNSSFVMLGAMVIILIAGVTPAHAYTDPGTGALIWQMLIAASVGVMFYARRALNWVRELFGKRRPPSAPGVRSSPPERESSEADH